jgi:hypothetical protein
MISFDCWGCGRGFNKRSGTVFNRLSHPMTYPADIGRLVGLWRLRYAAKGPLLAQDPTERPPYA